MNRAVAELYMASVNRKLYYGDTRSFSSFLEFEGEKTAHHQQSVHRSPNKNSTQAPWAKKLETVLQRRAFSKRSSY